jgi:hypothetical protein
MADGRFALIVACSRYTDATLTQLQAPEYDAGSLARVLSEPAVGDFEVRTLIDRPAVDAMQELESFFDARRRDDLLFLYFSGHGILDQSARLYFATIDTRVDRPRSTAIPAAFVNELMSECWSRRQVLVLDCCNSGSFARGTKAGGNIGTRDRFEGRGRVVITASDALQYAYESGQIEGEGVSSVFTEALVDGLKTGGADLDSDGYVTPDELYDYVYGRVVDASPRQRPGKWSFGVEGRIFIARTTRSTSPPSSSSGISASTKPAVENPREPQSKRPGGTGRRRAIFGGVALVVAAAIAAASLLLTKGAPPARGKGSSFARTTTSSSQSERDATLAVYRAWINGKLSTLTNNQLSPGARRALNEVPVRVIQPTPDACYPTTDSNKACVYTYSGLGIELHFFVIRELAGPRVDLIICMYQAGGVVPGGIAACARKIKNS